MHHEYDDYRRGSYRRGSGSGGFTNYSPRRLPGRSIGDGVVSRTYGKRNLYESDSEGLCFF